MMVLKRNPPASIHTARKMIQAITCSTFKKKSVLIVMMSDVLNAGAKIINIY
jgi:hypothetical protein